jgi:hypothetical protein
MLEFHMGDSVRFSEIVKTAGKPEIYLPLTDPRRDRNFMRAVQEERVLSLKQKPTETRKDFGVVGYVAERFVSYLVFSRPLTSFKGKRVIGIKYEVMDEAPLSASKASGKTRGRSLEPKATPKPLRPRKFFTATVRLTASNEIQVTVKAPNEKEARAKAVAAARDQADLSSAEVEAELLRVKGKSSSAD